MPMIPETVVAMLACARLGAPHTVVFGGFSAEALRDRILDCDARFVITADGGYRRGAASALKPAVDDALVGCPDVDRVLVVRRTGQDVGWTDGRDHWWHDVVDSQPDTHEAEAFDAEHPLYIMYTSGTTAKPKGIFHTSGGYLTHVSATHRLIFDIKPEKDVYWTAADIGWVTGHSYIVYGPLANATTSVLYEGTPTTPARDRWWQIVEKYKVTILYTAPTTIRTFMKWGEELPQAHDLSSLRLLGSVGEPINPEAWIWYRTYIGGERCPIVDTWWQTETGGIMITPLPGITATKPGAAMTPFPGIAADVVDNDGHAVGNGEGGYLVITEPWPGMLRGIWGDPERYQETYWSRFAGRYFAGDGAKKDTDGDLWLLGRVDDVMNVSGHRISTTEVEHALVGLAGRRRGGGRRRVGPDDRPGDRRLRHPEGRRHPDRREHGRGRRRAAGDGGHGHRADRPAPADPAHPRAAEDPQRQDHAAPAARRGREPGPRRRHDPHGPDGRQRHQGPDGHHVGRRLTAPSAELAAGPRQLLVGPNILRWLTSDRRCWRSSACWPSWPAPSAAWRSPSPRPAVRTVPMG